MSSSTRAAPAGGSCPCSRGCARTPKPCPPPPGRCARGSPPSSPAAGPQAHPQTPQPDRP
eukprot:166179-Hanusia_phi.AAC.11